MKKIPTLFEREYEKHKIVDIKNIITPGCEEAFKHGNATIKWDGSCCAFINGIFYKRYDCKKGKRPPEGAIPCCDPDLITGHWPHWVKVNQNDPGDKWFWQALQNVRSKMSLPDGTYEAIGPHFQRNPYHLSYDRLVRHGEVKILIDRDFSSIKKYLEEHEEEGLVFWLNGEPVCKIKRTDFGFEWPVKRERSNIQ